jgi:hypothetical protein
MIPYYYNNQLKKYLVQFMYVFSGLQVQVGKSSTKSERLIQVPIHFSQMDKVAANIVSGGTTNMPIRVPVMSCDVTAIRQDPLTFVGLNQTHSQTYLPENGFFASDVKTLTRLRPAVYNMEIDLAIWTSNTDQQFQILEQILPVFNPSVQIQTNDAQFDWTKISTITLANITINNNYPVATSNRLIVTNLAFTMPVYLSAPVDVKNEFVQSIKLRMAAVEGSLDDVINTLDDIDAEYETIASTQDIVDNINP